MTAEYKVIGDVAIITMSTGKTVQAVAFNMESHTTQVLPSFIDHLVERRFSNTHHE